MARLLELLRSESRLLGGLHSLGASGEASSQLMRVQVAPKDSSYAVDIRDNGIVVGTGEAARPAHVRAARLLDRL